MVYAIDIVMQLATQGCIRGLIREIRHMLGYVSENDARGFAFYTLRSIYAMHARGIVHQDLKPANLLRDWIPGSGCSFVGIISDLGGARHMGELQQAGNHVSGYNADARCKIGKPLMWTRGYSAPELGKADADARAHDMHCFGATLFELMTKRKLFSEEHHCKREGCIDTACTGRRRVYHFTQLRGGHYSAQAYVFIKQLVFPDAPDMRLSAAQALAHPWLSDMPREALMALPPDFVDETVFDFERDAYLAHSEGRHFKVAGPAPSKTKVPSGESGRSRPKSEEKMMDTDEQLYGKDEGEWATEDTSASFRVSVDELEVGQELHVWKVEHYRHDPADVVPTTDEWQLELPQADTITQSQADTVVQP